MQIVINLQGVHTLHALGLKACCVSCNATFATPPPGNQPSVGYSGDCVCLYVCLVYKLDLLSICPQWQEILNLQAHSLLQPLVLIFVKLLVLGLQK